MNDTAQALPLQTSVQPPRSLRARLARPAEIILGLVFLASAILKAIDVNAFIVAIRYYHVIPEAGLAGLSAETLKAAAALGTLFIETGLGAALLLGMRPRALIFGATALLLVFFSGLIAYAWAFHGLSDCGCIGPIKMGPAASIAKNVVLLALCAVAALGFRKRTPVPAKSPWKAIVSLALAVAVTGYSYANVKPPTLNATTMPGAPQQRLFAQFVFENEGITYDLGKGEFLVALLNMECPHCQEAVEKINALALDPGLPTVVSLGDGNDESREEFELMTMPEFPIHLLDIANFYSLIDKAPPRYIYIRDGRQIKFWDDEVPTPEQVQEARQLGNSPPTTKVP